MFIAVDLETFEEKEFGRADLAIRYSKKRVSSKRHKVFSVLNENEGELAIVNFNKKFGFPQTIWM